MVEVGNLGTSCQDSGVDPQKNICPQRVAESMYGCPFREPRVFEIAHIYIYNYIYIDMPNLE